MPTPRTLTVAAIQPQSRNFDIAGNLQRAEALVEIAAQRGAELVLCPELLAAGYIYDPRIWDVAEPRGGPTETWLVRMARRYRLYIGASYLEAEGDDFYNTFTLMKPDGFAAGRVRKQSLPGFEGWFSRSCSGHKVIETELGRIGVGICHDNNLACFMRGLERARVDLLLMPHSGPCIAMGPLKLVGEPGRELLRGVAGFYAQALGIPTVMANKAAGEDSPSPIPWVPLLRFNFHFVGQSSICDGGGNVCEQLDEGEGVAVSQVVLDPQKKRAPERKDSGYWVGAAPFLPDFPRISAALFQMLEGMGRIAYTLSESRRAAARKAQYSRAR
jgi:N-carbamoylputrescine amidase